MKKLNHIFPLWLLALTLPLSFIMSCDKEEVDNNNTIIIAPGPNAADEAQTAFIEAADGSTIIFEAGVFEKITSLFEVLDVMPRFWILPDKLLVVKECW